MDSEPEGDWVLELIDFYSQEVDEDYLDDYDIWCLLGDADEYFYQQRKKTEEDYYDELN